MIQVTEDNNKWDTCWDHKKPNRSIRRVWTMLSSTCWDSWDVLCRARSWDSMILMGPFQLNTFYGSVIPTFEHRKQTQISLELYLPDSLTLKLSDEKEGRWGLKWNSACLTFPQATAQCPRGDLTVATVNLHLGLHLHLETFQVVFKREMSVAIVTPVTGDEEGLIGKHLSKMPLTTKSKIIKSTRSHLSKHDQP